MLLASLASLLLQVSLFRFYTVHKRTKHFK
jgi:hypothetical protein